MKAMYKRGSLVQYVGLDKGQNHGLIVGTIEREDGFHYEIEDYDNDVAERDITAAFRPVATRKTKTARAAKSSKTASKTVTAPVARPVAKVSKDEDASQDWNS